MARRLLAPAHDGETIPVTLLYRKDTPLDGSAPLWLYGYGSYGISMPSGFNTNILSLVNRGFIYATAHIRGGQEKGRRWYKTGKMDQKMNTFRDFIAAGEHLVTQGLTRRGEIVAQGGSAGGLLMGAVANMAPDLFKAIVAEVPFVDALTTMLDDTLPLTPPEWPEWGNPIASKAAYETIAGLCALRERDGAGLSAPLCTWRPDRPARHLLGTGEVDGEAPYTEYIEEPAAAQDQHGRGPRRRFGAL